MTPLLLSWLTQVTLDNCIECHMTMREYIYLAEMVKKP
jgi:hypothetical protein